MPTSSRIMLGALGLFALVVVGWLLLVWPAYREAGAVHERVAELRRKSEGAVGQAREIDRLTAELEAVSKRIESEFKVIPDSPNIAGLMRALSLPVDGVTIKDQTFTAGQPKDTAAGAGFPFQALPLTVEMVARFDAVFALLRAAESQEHLVRVSSVNMSASRDDAQAVPLVTASVRLEAVFEPLRAQEGR